MRCAVTCNFAGGSHVYAGDGATVVDRSAVLPGEHTTVQFTPPRARRAHNRTLALAVAVVLVASCAGPDVNDSDGPPSAGDGSTSVAAATASIDGTDIVLEGADGTRTVIATVEDGELLYAQVRPGVTDPVTVLALTRAHDRYELRYVTVVEGTPTDLYWFPSRLQVTPKSAQVADVPTLPVWAPDGSGLAWLEFDEDGTRLRTVGWFDHDAGTNPSDEQATYALADVPLGTQLATWERDEDGTAVLVTRGEDDERWRIRIEDGEPIVALERVP